jgi:hypothetical protein
MKPETRKIILRYIVVIVVLGTLIFLAKRWEHQHPEKVTNEVITSPRGSAG